jgi:dephospho-CoA kinase
LNAIVHPRVREAMGRFVAEHAEAPMVVLEIPLLLESEDRAPVDEVVVVTASERARFGRLKRRGLSERRIVERLGSQMPQAKKVELADARIENDGDLEALRERIADFLSARQGAPAPSAAGR